MDQSFHSIKRKSLLKQKANLIEEYEAITHQLDVVLDPAASVRLKRAASSKESEIAAIEVELARLEDGGGNQSLADEEVGRLPDELKKYRNVLAKAFDLSELQELAFDMAVNWEDIAGETLSAKVRNYVTYCSRSSRLNELEAYIRRVRPGVEW